MKREEAHYVSWMRKNNLTDIVQQGQKMRRLFSDVF